MGVIRTARKLYGIWFIVRMLLFLATFTVGLSFTAGIMTALPVAGSLVMGFLIISRLIGGRGSSR